MIFLIFITIFVGLSFSYHIVFSILSFILVLIYSFKRDRKSILFLLLIYAGSLTISVVTPKLITPNNRVTGLVVEKKTNYFIIQEWFSKYYVYDKDSSYEVGDILTIKGSSTLVESKGIESAFDFKDYLNKKGVYYGLNNTKIKEEFLTPLRLSQFKNDYLAKYSDHSRNIIKAILFSSIEDDDYTSTLQGLHLTRLLSSAGIYVALFFRLIVSLFSIFMKRKYAEIIGIVSISVYNFFLFPKFAVIRFLSLKIFSFINTYFLDNKISYLNRLAISGLLFIFIDFHLTYQVSFILGYSYSIINYFLLKIISNYKKKKRFIFRYLFLFLFSIPIELYFYHEVSLLGYLLSILLTPLFLLIGLLGFISLIGLPLVPIVEHLVRLLRNISYYSSFINFTLYAPEMNDVFIFVYYLLFILLLYNVEIKFLPIRNILLYSQVIFIVLYIVPLSIFISSEVSFISVGQGDSTLIRKGATTLLIDTGGLSNMDIATESLIPYLKKKRIYDIDLVITTHNDYDHMGALDSLKENFKVKRYINEAKSFPLNIDGITIQNYNIYGEEYTDENDKSLVLGFNLFHTNFLIMGDAPSYIEKKIMEDNKNIPCDILKVGHHGSNTSSSESFIKYLSPKIGIISCGKNNKYKHPHHEVLNALKRYKVEIRRTDIEGTITYQSYFSF